MTKLFQHSPEAPFHISVGAVVVNAEGKILAHKITKQNIPAEISEKMEDMPEVYILMRESLENDETLEQAVHRGIREEFGVEGEIKKYLGSIQVFIPQEAFEKTTLYFHVALTHIGERPTNDAESYSDIEWIAPDTLLQKMKSQGEKTTRGDLDESKIIEAYVRYS